MGGIKRKEIQVLNNHYTNEKDPVSFCHECAKDGIYSVLGLRILAENEKPAEDYYNWRQCKICTTIFPIYETKTESKLEDFVETSNDPFGQGKTMMGNENKKKLTPRQKEIKRLKDEADKQKDPEIRAALKRGLDVYIIEDSMNYWFCARYMDIPTKKIIHDIGEAKLIEFYCDKCFKYMKEGKSKKDLDKLYEF